MRSGGWLRESVETVVIAFVLALIIRTFFVASILVEGTSMDPTLANHQRLLINKIGYRFAEPDRGDIVVFRYPVNPHRDFIKRVIARGGETVEIRNGKVTVDGQTLTENYVVWADDGFYPATTVPPGSVFVLGDNRMNSEDSRYFGFVPLGHIKGKAFIIYWPLGQAGLVTP